MKRRACLACVAGALAGAGCVGDDAASVGTATQREESQDWKIIQRADFNRDGLGDVIWAGP